MSSPRLPDNFDDYLTVDNAQERLSEAQEIADKLVVAGIPLRANMDHAAIFVDPPYLLAGPLKEIGYVAGWDARCYPSPVDGQDYINVPSGLPEGHTAHDQGWFRYVAVVHPVDEPARAQMLGQGYGNPFVHHLTWGIVPPKRQTNEEECEYAGRVVRFMVDIRGQIRDVIGDEPGTLIAALPAAIVGHPGFEGALPGWVEGLSQDEYQVEQMEGGGFLLQFFVLSGGRIEVALRVDTKQTFNPKSVQKISEDEISTVQN